MPERSLKYALLQIMENEKLNLQEITIIQLAYKKKLTISEISKMSNIDYKNAHRYVFKLHKKGLLNLNPEIPSQGKKVYITLSETLISNILEELERMLLRKDHILNIKHLINESRRKLRFLNLRK